MYRFSIIRQSRFLDTAVVLTIALSDVELDTYIVGEVPTSIIACCTLAGESCTTKGFGIKRSIEVCIVL